MFALAAALQMFLKMTVYCLQELLFPEPLFCDISIHTIATGNSILYKSQEVVHHFNISKRIYAMRALRLAKLVIVSLYVLTSCIKGC